jgi:DNA-binding GntR family transcriptional regulator
LQGDFFVRQYKKLSCRNPVPPKTSPTGPAFQNIKDYLLKEIQSGTWKEGDAIPSEAMLAEQFSVSRMTVNRAVRELTTEQILTRIQGSGTYVAQHKYQATLVEIKSIAEEIRSRGHAHRSELHELTATVANQAMALQFQVKAGHALFHISSKDACLVLHRKTLSQEKIATIVTMWHPGNRYQFAGSF